MKNINSIISIISYIHNSANKLIIEELKKNNLGALAPSHGDILVLLYRYENGLAMNKITFYINKDKSTLTALINKLEKLGYVEKIKNERDTRSTLVRLTKKGFETKNVVLEKISKKLLDKTYYGFSMEEKKELFSYLQKVSANFK